MAIVDARHMPTPPSLDVEGFHLYRHTSSVNDFRDAAQIANVHVAEIRALLAQISGADAIVVNGNGILRFGEKSTESGAHDNSRPARFVHIDCSDATSADFYARARPDGERSVRRSAQYNIWRVLTPPPQDVPLAVCDARSLSAADLIPADALFDIDGRIVRSFESLLLRHNPDQRWAYYSNMTPDEVLVFKTNDTDPTCAHHVPHGAFDDPTCPQGVPARASIEMRGITFWWG